MSVQIGTKLAFGGKTKPLTRSTRLKQLKIHSAGICFLVTWLVYNTHTHTHTHTHTSRTYSSWFWGEPVNNFLFVQIFNFSFRFKSHCLFVAAGWVIFDLLIAMADVPRPETNGFEKSTGWFSSSLWQVGSRVLYVEECVL